MQLKHPDKQIAAYLKKISLTEKLLEKDVEELQGEGLGPKASDALRAVSYTHLTLPTSDLV